MAAVNKTRVAVGVLTGGLVWSIWSTVVHAVILSNAYKGAYASKALIEGGRYKMFLPYWFLALFIITYILMWTYLSLRETLGPGPKTAIRVGFLVGFAIAFPINLIVATFVPVERILPFWWMMDLWVGAILATFVSAALYKEAS